MSNKTQNIIINLFCLVLALVFMLVNRNRITDDSYIFLNYAKNIVAGNGYVFNPQEYVNGTTSPLFTILIAFSSLLLMPFSWLVSDPLIIASRAIQLFSLFAILSLICNSFIRLGFSLTLSLSAALLLVANPTLASGIGMESYLVMALGLGAICCFSHENTNLKYMLAGAATLARPDAALLLALIFLSDCYKQRKLVISGPIISILVCLPWLVFSYFYFGTILPSTLSAKLAQTDTGRWGQGYIFLEGCKTLLKSYGIATPYILTLSLMLSCLYFFKSNLIKTHLPFLVLTWGLLHLLAYGLILNPPAYPWYYTFFTLPIAFAITLAFGVLSSHFRRQSWLNATFFCLLLTLTTIKLHSLSKIPTDTKFQMYKRLAWWLNQDSRPDLKVASNEVGILGYYFRGKIIDPLGLVSSNGASQVQNKNYSWYVNTLKPDYIITPHPPRAIIETYVEESWFLEQYKLAKILDTPKRAARIYKLSK